MLYVSFCIVVILHGISSEKPRSFPHHVGLLISSEWWLFKDSIICSGSLIADEWILTVATCYNRYSNIDIFYGHDSFYNGHVTRAKIFLRHEYSGIWISKNIAVVKIDPIVRNGFAKAIALPKGINGILSTDERSLIFTGWARERSPDFDKGLAISDVYLFKSDYCKNNHGTELCGKFSLGSEKFANAGSPLIYDCPAGRIQIGSYVDKDDGVARFVSLIDKENLEWIQKKILLWADLS